MKQFFINNIQEFKLFALKPGKNILFISLFYSLWFVINYIESSNLELSHFNNRSVSEATMEGIDVAKRVSLFYNSLSVFLLILFSFYLVGFIISKFNSKLLSLSEIKAVNYSSIAGIIYFLFHIYNYNLIKSTLYSSEIKETIEFLYLLHKIFFAGLIINLLISNKKTNGFSISLYAIIISLSL